MPSTTSRRLCVLILPSLPQAATLLLDLRSPYAATSDRCDGFLGIYGCPRVTEAVGFTAAA